MTGKRHMRRFLAILLGVGAAVSVFAIPFDFTESGRAASSAPEFFNLEFESTAPLEIQESQAIVAQDFALTVRTFGTEPDLPVFMIGGASPEIAIDRYETSWPVQEVFPIQDADQIRQAFDVQPSTTTHSIVSFNLSTQAANAAAVVVFDHVILHLGGAALSIEAPFSGPDLIGQRGHNPMHPEERRYWSLNGPHIVSRPPPFHANAAGSMHLYWTRGTAHIQTSQGPLDLESRIWDDPDTAGLKVRHAVWYEIRSTNATAQLSIASGPDPSNVRAVSFAPFIRLENATILALDSSSKIRGTLPNSNNVTGSSVWIYGNMSLDLRAVRNSDPSNAASTSSYLGNVVGTADAVAYGGGSVIRLSEPTVAAAFTLAVLLVGAAIVLRDLLADTLSRILAPLYSKLDQGRLLDHHFREAIFRAIEETPGIHYLGLHGLIRTKDGSKPIASGTLTHHLRHLERFGLVGSRRVGLRKSYYAHHDATARARLGWGMLRAPIARIVAEILLEHGILSQTEIYAFVKPQLAITLPGLRYRLRRMEREGLILRGPDGRYEPASILRDAITATPSARR